MIKNIKNIKIFKKNNSNSHVSTPLNLSIHAPHSSKERSRLGKQVALVGAVVNLALALLKLLIGYFGRSQALIADGVHSFSDLICDFLVLIAAKYGNADADEDHPYGHYRIETIITLALGLMLFLTGVGIAVDAAFDIAHQDFHVPSYWTLWVALISILANEFLFFYTRKIANQIDSSALRVNAAHARSDSLASIVVLVGLIGALLGWLFLDAVAAIVVSLIIIKMGLKGAWGALLELTDQGLGHENLLEIQEIILNTEGVLAMHQLRTRKMASRIYLDLHILIPPYASASEGHQIAERVHVGLVKKFPNIFDTTIHVDVENHPEVLPEKLLPTRSEFLNSLINCFEGKLKLSDIHHLNLYYLNNHLEAQLCLKKSLNKDFNLDLSQALKSIPGLAKIELMHHVQ